jgi:hypothetical protein
MFFLSWLEKEMVVGLPSNAMKPRL